MVVIMFASAIMCFVCGCVMARNERLEEEKRQDFEKRKHKAVFVTDLLNDQSHFVVARSSAQGSEVEMPQRRNFAINN